MPIVTFDANMRSMSLQQIHVSSMGSSSNGQFITFFEQRHNDTHTHTHTHTQREKERESLTSLAQRL